MFDLKNNIFKLTKVYEILIKIYNNLSGLENKHTVPQVYKYCNIMYTESAQRIWEQAWLTLIYYSQI